MKQPLLEAAGEWNKKQIIGVKMENCKGRGMAVVYSTYEKVEQCKVSMKQPLLEAAGEWNKKQIIGVKMENCKGRGMAVVYSTYEKVEQCK